MKLVIIILVLIVIGFAVAIGVGVARGAQAPSASGGPPTRDGKIDEDALADWKPPPMVALLGKVAGPFAPKLLKSAVQVSGQAGSGLEGGTPGSLVVEPSKKDMRIARVSLVSGLAVKATYVCVERDGRTCPQTVCLCAADTDPAEDDMDDCPETWRKAHRSDGGGRLACEKEDASVAMVVYPEGGVIKIEPMVSDAATVSIR
jgi:hypothetical protein